VACVVAWNRGLLPGALEPPAPAHLRWVLAPAAIKPGVQARARNVAVSLLHCLDYARRALRSNFSYGRRAADNGSRPNNNFGHITIEAARTRPVAEVRICLWSAPWPTDSELPLP